MMVFYGYLDFLLILGVIIVSCLLFGLFLYFEEMFF